MEILSTLVAFYSIVIVAAGLRRYHTADDIANVQHEASNRVSHINTSTNRLYLLLTHLGITHPLKALTNLKNIKQITPIQLDDYNDLINDLIKRASRDNDENLTLRDERKDNRKFRINFDFTATGVPKLSDILKFVPPLRLNPSLVPQKDDQVQDYNCTLSIVNCISKCSRDFPNENPKDNKQFLERWQCVLNCGNICGTQQLDAEELESKPDEGHMGDFTHV